MWNVSSLKLQVDQPQRTRLTGLYRLLLDVDGQHVLGAPAEHVDARFAHVIAIRRIDHAPVCPLLFRRGRRDVQFAAAILVVIFQVGSLVEDQQGIARLVDDQPRLAPRERQRLTAPFAGLVAPFSSTSTATRLLLPSSG